MKGLVSIVLISTAALLLSACTTVPYQGEARDIKRKPQDEGVIGIPLNFRDEDRAKAEARMKSNCSPSAFKILEEGEVSIGQKTQSSGSTTDRASTEKKVGSLWGIPITTGEAAGQNTQTSQVTSDVKEWRISYKCVASAESATEKVH